jgi:hypothetical protein
MNLETTNPQEKGFLIVMKSLSWVPGFLIVLWAASSFAGDAVAIGYNADGVWTSVTYFCSSTPKGGKDYKTQKEAEEAAIRDLRRRGEIRAAKESILSSSDTTGFVAVARGADASGKDVNVVGRGTSQSEADEQAFAQLKQAGATTNQKIVYRYFSHGADSK